MRAASAEALRPRPVAQARERPTTPKKPSYRYVREYAELGDRLPTLEAERDRLAAEIEAAASDHERLLELTAALDAAQRDLDAAETRWLELADLVGE